MLSFKLQCAFYIVLVLPVAMTVVQAAGTAGNTAPGVYHPLTAIYTVQPATNSDQGKPNSPAWAIKVPDQAPTQQNGGNASSTGKAANAAATPVPDATVSNRAMLTSPNYALPFKLSSEFSAANPIYVESSPTFIWHSGRSQALEMATTHSDGLTQPSALNGLASIDAGRAAQLDSPGMGMFGSGTLGNDGVRDNNILTGGLANAASVPLSMTNLQTLQQIGVIPSTATAAQLGLLTLQRPGVFVLRSRWNPSHSIVLNFRRPRKPAFAPSLSNQRNVITRFGQKRKPTVRNGTSGMFTTPNVNSANNGKSPNTNWSTSTPTLPSSSMTAP